MDWNHLNNFERGPTKDHSCGQNPISGLEEMLFKDCGRTDGHTDDDNNDDYDNDGRWVITKAHLELSAQVS